MNTQSDKILMGDFQLPPPKTDHERLLAFCSGLGMENLDKLMSEPPEKFLEIGLQMRKGMEQHAAALAHMEQVLDSHTALAAIVKRCEDMLAVWKDPDMHMLESSREEAVREACAEELEAAIEGPAIEKEDGK